MENEVLSLFAAIAFTATWLWHSRRAAERRRANLPPLLPEPGWAGLARARGLTYHPPDADRVHRLTGALDGLEVLAETRELDTEDGLHQVVDVRVALPDAARGFVSVGPVSENSAPTFARLLGRGDIEIDDDWLDGHLDIRGDAPTLVRAILAEEALHALLTRIAATRSVLSGEKRLDVVIAKDFVQAGSTHIKHVERLIDDALATAKVVADSVHRVREAYAEALGLRASPEARPGQLTLFGEIDGVTVHVVQDEGADTATVTATVPRPVLPAVRIRPAGDDGTSRIRSGDPLLDRMVAIEAADPDAARAVLVQDHVRENVLAVVAGRGGLVDGDGVSVPSCALESEALQPIVRDAVDLARALAR